MPHLNLFGEGCLSGLPDLIRQCGGSRILLITDANLVKCGISAKVEEVLESAGYGFVRYDGVKPNPSKENVYEAVELLKAEHCDAIIGLGGGSPNDCSKAVSIIGANGGEIEDYIGFNMSSRPGIPLITINTTAGTASEISRSYLISDEEKHVKLICKDMHSLAFASINDPLLMVSLPRKVTAETGMDALTHAVESYVCNNSYPLSKELAAAAIAMVFANLRKALENPSDIAVRDNMICAQSLAGMAFCNSGVGLDHSISHALGAMFGLPHGLCTAIVLPAVIKLNMTAAEGLYAELAERIFASECAGLDSHGRALVFLSNVEKLSQDVGTSHRLSEYGISEKDIPEIASKTLADGNIGRNPFMPDREQIESLLASIL